MGSKFEFSIAFSVEIGFPDISRRTGSSTGTCLLVVSWIDAYLPSCTVSDQE